MLYIDAQHAGNVWTPSESKLKPPWCSVKGKVICLNTLESIKTIDRKSLTEEMARDIWESIENGSAVADPNLLCQFLVLVYADLKKHQYYHWFAAPVIQPIASSFSLDSKMVSLEKALEKGWVNNLDGIEDETKIKRVLDPRESNGKVCRMLRCGFQSDNNAPSWSLLDIGEYKSWLESSGLGSSSRQDDFLVFWDPSGLDCYPGWPLRNILVMISRVLKFEKIRVICIRSKLGSVDAQRSLVLSVRLGSISSLDDVKFVHSWYGMQPSAANLGSALDPRKIADSAVDLNVQLMKWRAVPTLVPEKISKARCLLLGSGTLGCSVARCLIGWGIRNITFVDNSKVSFSNPVRQSLFEYRDCLEGGVSKAKAAAEALARIYPGCHAEGFDLTIPMPGHLSTAAEVEENTSKLDDLIANHDAVFMLLDTREARWAPTVMCAAHGKIAITAALGFDTFLVMRHGYPSKHFFPQYDDGFNSERLGCYFCNDIISPKNSTRDRSMDEQCTVARPGLSGICGSLAGEMLATILQHPNGIFADVPGNEYARDMDAPLGNPPHMIRGSLKGFSQQSFSGHAFPLCPACGDVVVENYISRKHELIIDAAKDDNYLERLSGLSSLHDSCLDLSNEEDLSDESWTDISSIVTNTVDSKVNLCSVSEVDIPILDLSSEATEQELANVLNKAAVEHGFFAVRGHGISMSLIKRHMDMQKKFFSLPMAEKMKIVVDNNNRGYTPIGEETLDPSNSTAGDQREGLYFGREIPSDDPRAKLPLHGPNQWPDEKSMDGYKETVEEYMKELTQFGIRLLSIVSVSLGLDRNHLRSNFFKDPMIFLRPLHYL